MDAGVVAIIVIIISAIVSPVVIARVTEQARRKDKQEDWARQDAVAAQAADAALLLLEKQDEIAQAAKQASQKAEAAATRLIETNERVGRQNAEAAMGINSKLDVVHRLVNSNMTAAMQSELDAKKAQRAALRVVIGYKQSAGANVTDDEVEINVLNVKIATLEATLTDRQIQQEIADAQQVTVAAASAGGVLGAAVAQAAVAEAAIEHEQRPGSPS